MFGKIFKAVVAIVISLALLGALWDIALIGITIKIVISAGLVAWIIYAIMSFKN